VQEILGRKPTAKSLDGKAAATFLGIMRYTGGYLRQLICHRAFSTQVRTTMAETLFTLNNGAKIPALGFGKHSLAFKIRVSI
jgi:hypothetical protein